MVLSSPGRARLSRPDIASFTASRTCRSCVTASTSPSDFALRASMVLPVSISGHRLHRIDQMREAHGAAEAGMQAEHHFRKTEPRIVDRDPHLAGQRHFEAAAEAEAVDHGDGRNPQGLQPVDHRMRAADLGLDRAGIGRAAEFVDVGAGDEAGRLGGANDEAGRPLRFRARPAPCRVPRSGRPTAYWRWRPRGRTTARRRRRRRGSA